MIAEGLSMLETTTTGVDLPQSWSLLETFFGKIESDFDVPIPGSSSSHATTYRAAKLNVSDFKEGDIDVTKFSPVFFIVLFTLLDFP